MQEVALLRIEVGLLRKNFVMMNSEKVNQWPCKVGPLNHMIKIWMKIHYI